MGRTIKIDITNKVVAKFRPNYLELYTSKFMIGKFYVYTEDKKYVLEDGYIYENGKFYRIIDTHRGNNQAAEGREDGVNMIRVKVFDESHEKDLEDAVNVFLKKIDDSNFVDIKYQVGVSINDDENQIYCFSAMIVYKA